MHPDMMDWMLLPSSLRGNFKRKKGHSGKRLKVIHEGVGVRRERTEEAA